MNESKKEHERLSLATMMKTNSPKPTQETDKLTGMAMKEHVLDLMYNMVIDPVGDTHLKRKEQESQANIAPRLYKKQNISSYSHNIETHHDDRLTSSDSKNNIT